MKTYKKLLVGAVSTLVMGLIFVTAPKPALATGWATFEGLKSCNSSFKWEDYAHISCTMANGGKVVFTDSNPDSQDGNGHLVFAPPPNIFCGVDPTLHDDPNNGNGGQGVDKEGVIVERDPNKTGDKYDALYFNEGYLARGNSDCHSFWVNYLHPNGHSDGKDNATIKASAHSLPRWHNRSAFLLAGTADGATVLPDVTDGPFAGYKDTDGNFNSFNFVRWKTDYDPPADHGSKVYLFAQGISLNKIGVQCSGAILAVTADGNDNSAGVREYTLGPSEGDAGGPLSNYPELKKIIPDAPNCAVRDYNFASGDIDQFPEQFYLSPQIKNISKIGEADVTKVGKVTAAPATCESSPGSFNWLACPFLYIAQDGANWLLDEFQGMLSFDVNQDLGNSNSQASVKKSWSMVRNLATAFLVILMLIMVFSQAISAGPFDAYTVRKMLPRLIVIAIAIQLSWAIVAWVIGIFNDLGKGIADIMYWPFGGAAKLDLPNLLSNAGIDTGTASTISWVGIPLLLGIGLAALPATILLLLGGVAALFTAYFTLIMRKIIIITLLVFAPIAMLAYVLPNTQKYWKLWYDNLIKILFMFPLIVIMIASGKIFADIAGGQGGNNTGGALNFVLVMVAYFGPLFLLPKTYKWGGQAMSIASGAVGGISNRYLGRESSLGKGLQGFGERTQGQIARGYDPSASRTRRIMRRVGSGHVLPTKRSQRLAIAAGDKWANDRNDEATALNTRIGEMARNGYDRVMTDKYGNYQRYKRNAAGELLDESNHVTTDKTKAAKETLSKEQKHLAEKERLFGVEAEKQAYVDNTGKTGSDANKRLAKAAHLKLLETSSEIELQKARIQGGEFDGKRVFETDTYDSTLQGSPQHYALAAGPRPDLAPDVKQGALADLKARGAVREDLTYKNATPEETKLLDAERLSITLSRLKPEDLQKAHYGMMEDIAKVGDAEVTWTDETGTERTAKLAEQLRLTLKNMADNGGQPGNVAIGSLRGGRERYVNDALASATPPNVTPPTLDTL